MNFILWSNIKPYWSYRIHAHAYSRTKTYTSQTAGMTCLSENFEFSLSFFHFQNLLWVCLCVCVQFDNKSSMKFIWVLCILHNNNGTKFLGINVMRRIVVQITCDVQTILSRKHHNKWIVKPIFLARRRCMSYCWFWCSRWSHIMNNLETLKSLIIIILC